MAILFGGGTFVGLPSPKKTATLSFLEDRPGNGAKSQVSLGVYWNDGILQFVSAKNLKILAFGLESFC